MDAVFPEICAILWNWGGVAPHESHALTVGRRAPSKERGEDTASRREKLHAEQWADMNAGIMAETIKSQSGATKNKSFLPN